MIAFGMLVNTWMYKKSTLAKASDFSYEESITINKPSDLTKLSFNNKGSFPFIETYLIIDGR